MSEARKRSISLTRSMTKGTEEMMMQIRGFLASHPQQAAQMGIEVRPSIGTARVAQALPEVAEKPPPPRTPSPPASPPPQPSSAREVGARRFWRRSFYALVIGILLLLGNYVSELAMLEEESHAKQEYVVQEVQTGKSWIVRVVVVQAVLLGFNAFLGYRGVKVRAAPPPRRVALGCERAGLMPPPARGPARRRRSGCSSAGSGSARSSATCAAG